MPNTWWWFLFTLKISVTKRVFFKRLDGINSQRKDRVCHLFLLISLRIHWQYPQQRGKIPLPHRKEYLDMTLICIWSLILKCGVPLHAITPRFTLFPCSGHLRNVEYSFIAITPRFTLIPHSGHLWGVEYSFLDICRVWSTPSLPLLLDSLRSLVLDIYRVWSILSLPLLSGSLLGLISGSNKSV